MRGRKNLETGPSRRPRSGGVLSIVETKQIPFGLVRFVGDVSNLMGSCG